MHPTRVIDNHELIFVKQGNLDMWEAHQQFNLEAGQTLHLWPGRQHGSVGPMASGLKFYWIHFEVDDGSSLASKYLLDDVMPAVQVPQVVQIAQPERMEWLFRTFLDDQQSGVLLPYSANLLTMMMLAEVAHSCEERTANQDDANVVATWAHTFIRMNYDRSITTSKVAAKLGYNADYLGRVYRQVYGCTLTEAIHRRRVEKACQYLLDSSLTVEQISEKCGFSDPDYFRRVFRRYTQVSPGNYRKEYSRMHVNTH
ncbi:MAG: AraC family transcriptional regulator [Anaerolineae bacterium]